MESNDYDTYETSAYHLNGCNDDIQTLNTREWGNLLSILTPVLL